MWDADCLGFVMVGLVQYHYVRKHDNVLSVAWLRKEWNHKHKAYSLRKDIWLHFCFIDLNVLRIVPTKFLMNFKISFSHFDEVKFTSYNCTWMALASDPPRQDATDISDFVWENKAGSPASKASMFWTRRKLVTMTGPMPDTLGFWRQHLLCEFLNECSREKKMFKKTCHRCTCMHTSTIRGYNLSGEFRIQILSFIDFLTTQCFLLYRPFDSLSGTDRCLIKAV